MKTLLALSPIMLCACLLSACTPPAAIKQPTATAYWQQRDLQLQARRDWQVNGRVFMQQGKQGWSAPLTWQQHGDNYEITLANPLGSRMLRLQGDAEHIAVTTADGTKHSEGAVQRLLRRWRGQHIPLGSLRYWALALAAPDSAAIPTFDEHGRLMALKQQQWQLRYQDYRAIDGIDLPHRIDLQNARYKIKLALHGWRFSPSPTSSATPSNATPSPTPSLTPAPAAKP